MAHSERAGQVSATGEICTKKGRKGNKMADYKGYKNGTGKEKKTEKKTVKGLFNYHPTEGDKKVLRELPWGVLEALEALAEKLEEGCRLSISPAKGNNAMMFTLRAAGDDWANCPAISTAHNDLAKGLITLAYAIQTRAPKFPEQLPIGTQIEFDW